MLGIVGLLLAIAIWQRVEINTYKTKKEEFQAMEEVATTCVRSTGRVCNFLCTRESE